MKLSVVIPCFNAADTIAVQLEALANQNWSEAWEVIIADNGSTDETLTIVERYKEKLPNLKIINTPAKRGAAHARNVGVLAATSDAIAFCDADDEVAPGWVAAMGKALSKHDFVACKSEYTKLNQPWTLKYRPLVQQDGVQEYTYPPYLPHAAGSALGVRRSVHKAVGGFDETLYKLQDTDYCWRIQLTGTKLHFVPEAVVHYRLRDNLEGLYHQARLWGEYNVFLYKRYRPLGMPKLSWRIGVRRWLRFLKAPMQVFSKESRAKLIWNFAWQFGRLQGCIKYRVLAL